MTDRELEDFLAEKVMGWKPVRNEWGTLLAECDEPFTWRLRYEDWRPLSDIAQAWQLIDKLSAYPESAVFVVCQPHDGNMASCMVYRGGARSYDSADVFLHLKDEEEFSRSDYARSSDTIKPAVMVAMKTAAQAICVAAAMWRGWKPTVESSV